MSLSRIRLFLTVAPLLVIAGTASSQASANTFYVSASGNDSNPGTISSPFASPSRAVTVAAPGDTIFLRQGTYTFTTTLVIAKDGVTLSAYQNEKPALVGSTTDLTNLLNMVYITGNNVSLIGLEIQGGSYYGVKLESNTGVVIKNCRIHDTGRDNVKMYLSDNAQFLSDDMGPTGVRDTTDAQCINSVACNGAIVRGCHFHDSAQNGLYLKGGASGGLIEDNLIERCGYGGILLGQDTDLQFMRDGTQWEAINCVARNNVIISCGGPGLGTYSGNNIRFENNTCWDVAKTYNGGLYIAANSRSVQAQQITFKNNIVAVTSSRPMFFSILLSDQLNSDYNLYFRPNGGNYGFWMETPTTGNYWSSISNWQSGMGADSHSLIADPHLDSTNLYKPLSGSPAIDAGTNISEVPVDYAGTARPQGKAYDIGAFEISQSSTNRPPTVSITASATAGAAPLNVNFVSTASDPDGQIVGYQWAFGDGATTTAVSPSHVYNSAGNYTASLTVTDNGGLTASASVTVSVTAPVNLPPQVSISSSTTSGAAPLTVNFVSTASDPDGRVVSYAWSFGDGGTSSSISPSYVYNNAGTFTARLTVTDDKGATASASVVINVSSNAHDLPPQVTATATPTNGTVPLTVHLIAGGSDQDGSAVTYSWNFGDGQSSTAAAVSHVYNSPGSYTARVTVTDSSGLTATASVVITVTASSSTGGTQNVIWTNLIGVSASGNNVTKTAPSTWGNAGASSSQSITNGEGYFQFTAAETSIERMAGLSATNLNKGWADIAFAVHLNTGAAFYVTESGKDIGYFGDYRTGDLFRVTVHAETVTYSRNGVVFYTSKVKPTATLWSAAVLDGTNSTIDNGIMSGSSKAPVNQINVLSPSTQAVVRFASAYTVTWDITNADGASLTPADLSGSSVDVVLSVDGGVTWNTIASGVDASLRSFDWTVPSLKSKDALIQIQLTSADGSTSSGTSGAFKIKKSLQ